MGECAFIIREKARAKREYIYGCRCYERLKAKTEGSKRLAYTGLPGGDGTGKNIRGERQVKFICSRLKKRRKPREAVEFFFPETFFFSFRSNNRKSNSSYRIQLAQTNRGLFQCRHAAFSSMLESRVGNILAKAVTLRINLNLDGVPITSKSHTHPSHSQTSRLLTSSLSLGVPVPRPTQCM
jgi:hypothetical protein